MKITLTKQEILKVLSHHFGMDVEDYVVAKPHNKLEELQSHLKTRLGLSIFSIEEILSKGKKIDAIKAIREVCPYGLAEAKWITEHWYRFAEYVKKHGRFPKLINPLGGLSSFDLQ